MAIAVKSMSGAVTTSALLAKAMSNTRFVLELHQGEIGCWSTKYGCTVMAACCSRIRGDLPGLFA